MKKISFSEVFGLQQAVLSGKKTMTHRIANTAKPLYKVGEVVAVAQRYSDIYPPDILEAQRLQYEPGWRNKMFVAADLMLHHIRITSVRKENIQTISDEDCFMEGICKWTKDRSLYKYDLGEGFEMFEWRDKPMSPREAFATLIDKISGRGTWESNPEVWVYEFELVK